jgi:GTP cyclohydrolase IA
MNSKELEKLIKKIIEQIDDPSREGLEGTPARVAKSFEKLYGGYSQDPKKLIKVFDNEGYDEMIICRNIDFYSMCEHHMLPFFGRVYIGYLPDNKIIGLSKLPRMVEIFSRRLQNQERLTKQIADTLNTLLKPKGVGVVIKATHLCMKARGVEKENCEITTSAFTGLFKSQLNTRSEFLNLINN